MNENKNRVEKNVGSKGSGTKSFKQLGLNKNVLFSIDKLGFKNPSEVQEKAIPLILNGKDVIARSATGSGKTFAFGVGILKKVIRGAGIQALVLTPTRELADQVAENLRTFSASGKPVVKCVYGGISIRLQTIGLKRADIVVGTPGRIFDHLKRKTLNLNKIKILVLDEADRMVDMGFIKDVEKIIEFCNKDRQTLLFSATLSKDIEYIEKKHMKDPVRISAVEQVDPTKLYQTYYKVSFKEKFSLLTFLLKLEKKGVVMVFCNTRRDTSNVADNLGMFGVDALAIHGGLSQNRRDEVLRAFRLRDTFILVCTDVAARGLDIKGVTHVYNYDIPKVSSDYIHRIGRTARAGKKGEAITFVSEGTHGSFNRILRENSLKIEKLNLPKIEMLSGSFDSNSNEKRYTRKIGKRQIGHRKKSFMGNKKMRIQRKKKERKSFKGNRKRDGKSRRY